MAGPSRPATTSNFPHNLTLPGLDDLRPAARPHPAAGPSSSRAPATHFGQQQDPMSAVDPAHASADGGRQPYYDNEGHPSAPPMTGDPAFDILDWYPAYQSCQRYFLDIAQYEPGTQALCALINIRLPFQYLSNPITSSSPTPDNNNNRSPSSGGGGVAPGSSNPNYGFTFSTAQQPQPIGNLPSPSHSRPRASNARNVGSNGAFISLIPYLRRLTITGFDKPAILHGFFGDDYARGVLPHLDCERRNYLFAAKHGGWRTCKKQYDVGSGMGGAGGGDEMVPFMKPLEDARGEELRAAEKAWGRWLAMEDWMVGERAPSDGEDGASGRDGNGYEYGFGYREAQQQQQQAQQQQQQ